MHEAYTDNIIMVTVCAVVYEWLTIGSHSNNAFRGQDVTNYYPLSRRIRYQCLRCIVSYATLLSIVAARIE